MVSNFHDAPWPGERPSERMINIVDEIFNEYLRSLGRAELLRIQKYILVENLFLSVFLVLQNESLQAS